MDKKELKAGDPHYLSYVGPPDQYDFMGATQFRLLCSLGLRDCHKLLDFGCGSLRAGKFFMLYLDKGNYFGVEPNEWLIEDSKRNELGEDLFRFRQPNFSNNSDFEIEFKEKFDYILVQSIFSHAGIDLIEKALQNFKSVLSDNGIVVATFVESREDFLGSGWVYPGCVGYQPTTVHRMAQKFGFFVKRIPWYHPRQSWYVLALKKEFIPNDLMATYLSGAVLFQKDFENSWKNRQWTLQLLR